MRLEDIKKDLTKYCPDLNQARLDVLTSEQIYRIDAVEVVFEGSGCDTIEEATSSALFSEYEEIITGK